MSPDCCFLASLTTLRQAVHVQSTTITCSAQNDSSAWMVDLQPSGMTSFQQCSVGTPTSFNELCRTIDGLEDSRYMAPLCTASSEQAQARQAWSRN